MTSVRRELTLKPLKPVLERASGMRIFEGDEIVTALEERGFTGIHRRLSGMVQFVGGRLAGASSQAALLRAVAPSQALGLAQARRRAVAESARVGLDFGDALLGRREDRLDLDPIAVGDRDRPDRADLGLERRYRDLERDALDLRGIDTAALGEQIVCRSLDLLLGRKTDPVCLTQELDLRLRLRDARRKPLVLLVSTSAPGHGHGQDAAQNATAAGGR